MRIAIVTSMKGFGGTENVSSRLAIILAKKNHDVTLIAGDGPLVKKVQDAGVKLVDIDFYGGLVNYFVSICRLIFYLSKNDLEIIHCQMARPVVACWIAKVFARKSLKIIWHSRGLRAGTYKFVCPLFSLMQVYAIANCRHEMEKLIRHKYNKKLVSFSYNPIPEEEEISFFPRKDGTFVIGSLSRLSVDRCVNEAIYIFAELIRMGVRAKLIIGGDGPELNNLKILSRNLNIDDKIEFLGRVTSLKNFFSKIDVLVNTIQSSGDNGAGIGNNIIESALFKIPVVAYDSCGISEAVLDGVTGYCIPINQRHLFVSRLAFLAENVRHRVELGENLNSHINRICSVEKVYNDLISIYDAAICSKF